MKIGISLFAVAAVVASAANTVQLEGNPPVVRARVPAGFSSVVPNAGWKSVLRLSVDHPGAPALAGTYHLESNGDLIFTPRYTLQSGLDYRADLEWQGKPESVILTPAAKPESPRSRVENLYPTAGVWPENQLRFYVHFSMPMSRGEAFDRLHLIDRANGKEIEKPFLEIDEELWDREQKRLTILFDPGRVKRGLVPNHDAGPPLVDGGKYTLVVDGAWKDAQGRAIGVDYRRDFAVGPAVREGIDIAQWKISLAGDTLAVDFPRPLDAALALRCLSVEGIEGAGTLSEQETRWTFQPVRGDTVLLEVRNILEDLAGNKVGRAFDVELDRFDQVTRRTGGGVTKIPVKRSTPKP